MRKEKIVTLIDRDKELTFKIREMPATKLESWIIRAGLCLADTGLLGSFTAGADAGDVMVQAGKAMSEQGLSLLGKIDYDKAKPLIDELMECCSRLVDGVEHKVTSETLDGYVEDVKTLFTLKKEALAVNFSFFATAGQSTTQDDGTQPPASSSRKISVRS